MYFLLQFKTIITTNFHDWITKKLNTSNTRRVCACIGGLIVPQMFAKLQIAASIPMNKFNCEPTEPDASDPCPTTT